MIGIGLSLPEVLVNGQRAAIGGGGGGYVANAVQIDGASQYLTRASLVGSVDTATLSFSAWIKPDSLSWFGNLFSPAADPVYHYSVDGGQNDAQFWVALENQVSYPTASSSLNSGSNSLTADNWQWVAGCIDVFHENPDPKIMKLFFNGVDVTSNVVANPPAFKLGWGVFAFPDWGTGDPSQDDSPFFKGGVADFWWGPSQFVDFSDPAVQAKFSDDGKPVFLGDNGELPTGTQPWVFLSGDADAFVVNRGSGGALTVHGAWTNATTSPSD